VGIGVAWAGQVFWLFVAAADILGEELLETSVIIETLKRAPSTKHHQPHSVTAGDLVSECRSWHAASPTQS
jgi:hypothetical protein